LIHYINSITNINCYSVFKELPGQVLLCERTNLLAVIVEAKATFASVELTIFALRYLIEKSNALSKLNKDEISKNCE